jgi:hypothetical protein
VLTEAGLGAAYRAIAQPVGPRLAERTCRLVPAPGEKPRWDRASRELWFAGTVVRYFRRGARNQERLLDAFQGQGWPEQVADPLPRHPRLKAAGQLRDAVKHLNAGLAGMPLRFRVSADAGTVFWAPCDFSAPPELQQGRPVREHLPVSARIFPHLPEENS